jgi:hypothetical protein
VQNVATIVAFLNRTRANLLAVTADIQDNQWRQQPRAGGWSAGEVIAHLTMVESQVIGTATRMIGAPAVQVPMWKQLHLPVRLAEWRGIRVKTPIPLDPKLVGEKQSMLERFAVLRQRTLAFIEENQSRELGDYRFPHPFFGSLNLYDCLRMIAFHEARHTRQMQEIVDFIQP